MGHLPATLRLGALTCAQGLSPTHHAEPDLGCERDTWEPISLWREEAVSGQVSDTVADSWGFEAFSCKAGG